MCAAISADDSPGAGGRCTVLGLAVHSGCQRADAVTERSGKATRSELEAAVIAAAAEAASTLAAPGTAA